MPKFSGALLLPASMVGFVTSASDVTREGVIAEPNKLDNFNTGVQSANATFDPGDHRGIRSIEMIGLVRQREVLFEKYPAKN